MIDFREFGSSTFGSDLTERGLFTVWTLRKIYDLAKEISASPVPKEIAQEDAEKAGDLVRFALWNRFHLDCLTKSMRAKKPIYPEVVDPVRDGLRAAVGRPEKSGSEQEFEGAAILRGVLGLLKFDEFGVGHGHALGLQQ